VRSAKALRHFLVAVTVLVIGICTVQADPRIQFHRSQFGIVAFDLNGPVPPALATLGIGLVRGSCDWSNLEPARGTFAWGCADNVILGAQARGLRSYMTVSCTPPWANGGTGCGAMPADISDWYTFVQNFVSRYSLANTVLGVWNEPNLELLDDPAGDRYALLFVNASNARNVVNPRFVLGGPETSHHALAKGYYAHTMDTLASWRALDPQDVIAVHWYHDGPPLADYMDAINESAAGHQVWLTETGYSTADPSAQATFFDDVLTTFVSGGRAWWTHVVFYRLWDGYDCCTEAIVDSGYAAKPAFNAYRRWIAASIGGAIMNGRDGIEGPSREALEMVEIK